MANLQNSWIGYISRGYHQIKADLLANLTITNPEVTDHSSSNILVIILDMFAGVSEMLGLYIDNMAREAFLPTCRRFTSIIRITRLIDYHVESATGANVDLTITFDAITTGPFIIPQDTEFKSTNGISFITTQSYNVPVGTLEMVITAWQYIKQSAIILGTTTGLANESFILPQMYVEESLTLTVGVDVYTRKRTLAFSSPTDLHFLIQIDTDGRAYIVFGDGINATIPFPGVNVVGDYYETTGPTGNVGTNTITNLVSTLAPPGVSQVLVNNLLAASGGSLVEDIERIRKNAPLSIRTLERMVTHQDYVDVTLLAPGVGKACVDFDCGKTVDIYIVPQGGGIAQSGLLSSTFNFDDERRMVTTFINVLPAGLTPLKIQINATANIRQDPLLVRQDIIAALTQYGSFANMDINNDIRLSDIYALVDNLPRVDFLELQFLATIPYARPYNNNIPLNWQRQMLPGSTTKMKWRLVFVQVGLTQYIRIFKNNAYKGQVLVGIPWVDANNIWSFTVLPGAYTHGMEWRVTTYGVTMDIPLDDFTLPYVDPGYLSINVNPQYSKLC